jgi:hypothetical protein
MPQIKLRFVKIQQALREEGVIVQNPEWRPPAGDSAAAEVGLGVNHAIEDEAGGSDAAAV